ncbi:hypothetical protein DyAD56_16025 [Dyella sp. AD56]|uniref:hypothetical protein n=1 Tax=Dyella sp. AD56 TaxID=1528744 RepID=UPI000C81DF9E|nr:hypothetical protein [Dyella sp. AD56]PMQ04196.1 hypothetical protein DyAD56_16025 [Dyella sp. AD56]
MSAVYPAELFVLRRQVRNVSLAPASVTRTAERIALRARAIGISTFRAREGALNYLASLSYLGGMYVLGASGTDKPKGTA